MVLRRKKFALASGSFAKTSPSTFSKSTSVVRALHNKLQELRIRSSYFPKGFGKCFLIKSCHFLNFMDRNCTKHDDDLYRVHQIEDTEPLLEKKISEVVGCLALEDEILVTKQGVRQFLKRYSHSGTIARKPGSRLPPKLSPGINQLIEDTMRRDDESTATQLQVILANRGVYVSLATIVRNRCLLGWIYRGSAYCQLIRNANKIAHLQWAQASLF